MSHINRMQKKFCSREMYFIFDGPKAYFRVENFHHFQHQQIRKVMPLSNGVVFVLSGLLIDKIK